MRWSRRSSRIVGLALATLLTASAAAVVPPPGPASAAIDDTRCIVEPTSSTGTQAGVAAVAVGEHVRLGTEVDLPAGVVYQDILANPNGSTYVSTWLGTGPADGSELLADLSTMTLSIDGVDQPLQPGTEPRPDGFVLDTSDAVARVYFPGDPAVLADPSGGAAPSYTVPDGGQTFRLTYLASVPDLPAGHVTPAAICQAAISYGEANAAVDERTASVAMLGLDVRVDKTANLPVLAPGTSVTYSLEVAVPAFDDAGELRNGSAYDVVVTDTLPEGLDYAAGSASHGGAEAGGVLTWTIPEVAAGTSVTVTYDATVPVDAEPGATYTNAVAAQGTSLPGDVDGEATSAPATDSVTLANGAEPPDIAKSADVDVAGTGQVVTFQIDLTWPADSTWYDVTLTDLLPDGFSLVSAGSFTCAPVACPPMVSLAPYVSPGGTTRFGSFVEQVGPFADDQAWRWTLTARMTGSYAGGAAVPLGTTLENLAEARFNLVPRLGGATPNPARLNEYDGTVAATDTVEFDRPVIAIDKAAPTPSTVEPAPAGVTYTVTLSNTGGVAATNVTFTDPGPSSGGYRLGTIAPASVTGAAYNAGTGTFTVANVPAGGTATITYRVVGSASDAVAVAADYHNTATVTGYRDPANNLYTSGLADVATVTVEQPSVTVTKERLSPSPIAGTDGERITYRVTVANPSDADAYSITGTDELDFPGTYVPGTCTGGMTLSATGAVSIPQLAAGAAASCTYDVELDGDQPAGDLDNAVTIAWRNGFGQTGEWTAADGIVPWTARAEATTVVVEPQLALQKGPEADTPGNVIANGGTGSYTVSLTNVGPVTVHDVVLADTLPAGLALEAAPGVTTVPAGLVHTVTGGTGDASFVIVIPALAPGDLVQVTIPVRHDGDEPIDEQLVNTATVSADGLDAPLTDTGVLVWVPSIELPVASKSATPDTAGIGEEVTWTVTATIRENVVELYDVAFVDTLPRGMTLVSIGTASCVSGPLCATVPAPSVLAPVVQTSGETRLGWFIGDVPAGTGTTIYSFTFTAAVAETYEGTGTPAAGTPVTDTFLVNRVQPWFTTTAARDRFDDGSLPTLSGPLGSQFERRGAAGSASLHATTPRVVADKDVTNLGDRFDWSTDAGSGSGWMADVGDEITYDVTFRNAGAATAYDIEVVDSMGQMGGGATMLRDVELGTLPADVTVVDGWTLADPDVVLHIEELAAGASITVTYTGVVAPSEQLVPGFSGDNRDVALIRNTVEVTEFHSAPDGGLSFDDTFATGADVYVYTPSPYLTGAGCVGSSTSPAGTTATFTAVARNGAPPLGETTGTLLTTGYPEDLTMGVGYETTLTVVLSPHVRYVPGTTEVSGTAAADPTTSLDSGTSVQTLVFDLGDYAQGESHAVTFDVRTIADGVQGGMRATLTMDDALGSPSRGTSSPGAAYVYEHVIARGCLPSVPVAISKFPDLDYRYEGQKRFEVGDVVEWFGGAGGAAGPFHDGELVDRMPDGIDYTPGSAVLTITRVDGSVVVASAANGNLTETITPLPDGRTELRFTSPELAEFRSFTYRLGSVVAADAIVGANLTNVVDLITSDGIVGNCGSPTVAVCDNGSVQIISSATPTITKSVDHPAGPWGDTFAYTVDVTLPGDVRYYDAFIGDRGDYPRALDGTEPFAATSIECIAGCAADPNPVTLPAFRNDDDLARAWFLGDLSLQQDDRIYRITYQQTFVDQDEYLAEFGTEPTSEEHVNTAIVGWNDADVLSDASYQQGGPAHTAASSRTFAVNGIARAEDQAAVTLVRPELSVTKTCAALNGRDDPATSTSIGHATTGSVPNFRCTLTATNATDESLATTITDPVLVDMLPTVSTPGGRPITTQLVSWASDELLVDVESTTVAGSPLTPPAATSLRITAEGVELAPGESVSVTVDLRVTASPAFRDDTALRTERSRNTLEADAFADVAGNAYAGDSTDSWDLVIEKPKLTVSQRAWSDGGYDASLADGRPTACMAYASKPDPVIDARVAIAVFNLCANLKDARSDESSPGGEYARAYGGGAPDVVLGATEKVTWAVDTAVVSADDFATVSVADRIPYGFEYVPGSARLAHWSETGTTHTPLGDPVVGPNPAVTCSSLRNVYSGPYLPGQFNSTGALHGQAPWTPLTWNFAAGAGGAAGAFWADGLAYLHAGNRDAAGALDSATPFDRIVRVVFDVRPRAEFAACLQTPQRSNSFRSEATATGTSSGGTAQSAAPGWVVGVELARVAKAPDAAVSPDGTTATYAIDVTITDPTRLRNVGDGSTPATNFVPATGIACATGAKPAAPTRTPWIGLGDLTRNGTPLMATFTSTPHGTDFGSRLVVTDTFVDDGLYVPGSATIEMFDPWGRPFAGHLASEDVQRITVDGRQASVVTWTFDHYPSPVNVGSNIAPFPCPTVNGIYVTHPSSMRISVPLDIPDGTPDGTTYPNTADARVDHLDGGEVVRTHGDADDALVTVRNPLPPPPATKTAVPDEVAPGATFDWVVEAELEANGVWFDLGWTDELPASMELVGYGTPTCVVTGTATPCPAAAPVPSTLTPVVNGDGSTTVGWFVGDVVGVGVARTLRMPLTVRFVGSEVAGDELTNVVVGYSNEDDEVDELTGPADPAGFAFRGEPVVGTATVVEPVLELSKVVTSGPGPYQAGDVVTYEVSVTNTGTATAYDVPVVDTPDAFLTSVTTTSPFRSKGWTALDPSLEWFVPEIDAGETVTFDVAGTVATGYLAGGVRELVNRATLTGYTSRPETEEHARAYGGAQATAAVPLVAPNVDVEKHAGAGCDAPAQTFAPGEPVAWCVVVANTGDAAAFGVTLTDLLPPGWTYDTGSAEVDGAAVEPVVSTTATGTERLVWTLGELAPDAEVVVTYRTIGPDDGEPVTNTAIVGSTLEDGTTVPDPAPGFRDRDDAQAAPLGAGLQISKLPDSQRLECDRAAGCSITWDIVVVNADERDLTGATLTDFLPAGLTYEGSVTAAGWSDAVVDPIGSGPSGTTPITWTHLGAFESGAVAAFEVTALVPPGTAERGYLNHAVAGATDVPDVENQALAAAFATASLGDRVWHDVDADGRQDDGEPGIAGVTVQLFTAGAAPGGPPLATTATDADGRYRFTDLDPGDYVVRFLPPGGWVTSPLGVGAGDLDSDIGVDGRTAVVTLLSGTDDLTWDAGLHLPPSPPPGPPATGPSSTTTTAPDGQATTTTVPPSGQGIDDDPPVSSPGGVGGSTATSAPSGVGSDVLARTGADLQWLALAGLFSLSAGWLVRRPASRRAGRAGLRRAPR